ncbi:MAG: NfeD family protein [Butyrivibrio sp.]|nr:NfeD family protein [Butyrivibrio sp.]
MFENLTLLWLIVCVALAIIELITFGLVTIWFAFGALVACLASLAGIPLMAQLILFIIVSIVVMILVRPLATKYVNSRVVKTNIDAAIGKQVAVTQKIDNSAGSGKVTMEGSNWNAVSQNDSETFEIGDWVEVVKVEGTKLFVKALKNE